MFRSVVRLAVIVMVVAPAVAVAQAGDDQEWGGTWQNGPPTTFPQAFSRFDGAYVGSTGLVYILLYGAIQKLPTHLTGSLSFIYPVVAIAVDDLAFGHRLRPVQLVGAVAILLAAAGNNLGWSARRWPLRRGA